VSILEAVISVLGGAAGILVIAAFLGRRFIDLQVERAIEKYKTELQQKSEILKAELSIYAHEQNVGLSRLDGQRSNAIQVIYAVAIKWQELFLEITQPTPPRGLPPELQVKRYLNLAQRLVRAAEELSVKSQQNALFFPDESYGIIARFGIAAMDLGCAFYDSTFGKVDVSKDLDHKVLLPMIEKERATLRAAPTEDFGKLQKMLVVEFRRLMKAERTEQLTPGGTDGP